MSLLKNLELVTMKYNHQRHPKQAEQTRAIAFRPTPKLQADDCKYKNNKRPWVSAKMKYCCHKIN